MNRQVIEIKPVNIVSSQNGARKEDSKITLSVQKLLKINVEKMSVSRLDTMLMKTNELF
jgi:hypothetical protein